MDPDPHYWSSAITDTPTAPAKPLLPWPMPDPMHLYMLVAGIVLGILLGPAVLGKAAPSVYDKLFLGSGDTSELQQAQAAIDDFEKNNDYSDRLANVKKQGELFDSGESPAMSVQEELIRITNEYNLEREEVNGAWLEAFAAVDLRRQQHTEKLAGIATLLLLLTVVVMLVEPILAPSKNDLGDRGRAEIPAALPRLITLRYALLAGWIVLALAKPVWLLSIDPVFAIILTAVVGVAAFVPLGKAASAAK